MNNQRLVILLCILHFVSFAFCRAADDEVRLEPGMVITKNTRIANDKYVIAGSDDRCAVAIKGDNIVVDFQGAILIGSVSADADTYIGNGVAIRGKNITLKNAVVQGYKVGIFGLDSPHVTLDRCDVSRNYRQRLKSTIEREDLSDWLYGHENDQNEWLKYGAGIYLQECPEARIERCRSRNGQNGLCLVRCDRARVADCDMSFMSGWGLAMWRSSECEIFNNKFDWCIRGYSHGVYSRGQDSAGILVYEQCNKNVFAFNSATHGGDGLFLYGGNETLKKTGRGGCNGNVVYQNDFSHAAANGIEATFSEGNYFVENILNECEHGIWAGYSYNSVFERNTIRDCKNGISIEHGRKNRITGNPMFRGDLGIHLWWDEDKELLSSEFCRAHDGCPSSENIVCGNHVVQFGTAIRLVNDSKSAVFDNMTHECTSQIQFLGKFDSAKLRLTTGQKFDVDTDESYKITIMDGDDPLSAITPIEIANVEPRIEAFRGTQNAFLPEGARRGREHIYVDEWGPYDFKEIRVFPKQVIGGNKAVAHLLGDGQSFEVTDIQGAVKVEPKRGKLPAKLTIEATQDGIHSFRIGVRALDLIEHVQGVLSKADWKVSFHHWSSETDPRNGDEAWKKILANKPIAETSTPSIDFIWGHKGPSGERFVDHFATVATSKMKLAAGDYRLTTVSDDGVRVFVDGKEVLANWTYHGPTENDAVINLAEGEHEFRVEHFEIDGHAQLQVRLAPTGPFCFGG